MSEVSSKDKQLILSSRQGNEPAGTEGGLEEELDFLTEILTTPSQDNITVLLLLLCGGGGGDIVVRQDMFIKFYNLGQSALPTSSMVSRLIVSSCTQPSPLNL